MADYVSTLIKAAMRTCGALNKGEDPDAGELQDGLEALTFMLRSWAARRLLVRALIQQNFPLTALKGSYTIGSGGDFNTTKPISVKSAFIRDSNTLDTGLDVVTRDVIDSFMDKGVSYARPIMLCYDPGEAQQATQTGTILLYQIPDNTSPYTLYMDVQRPFTDFTTINDVVTFDPPYDEAIKYELAIRLWREYHSVKEPVPRDLYELANEAMHTVENMNSRQIVAGLDLPGMKGNVYNIYTGGYDQ